MHYSHKLEKQKHKDFLLQQRVDPITGERIEAGHKIVICSACKSAFFEESWEYLGGKHCNQEKTLSKIPVAESIKIKFKELDFEFDDVETDNVTLSQTMLGMIVMFIWVLFLFAIGLTPMFVLFYYVAPFLEGFLEVYVYVPILVLIGIVVTVSVFWFYLKEEVKFAKKNKLYRKYKRIVLIGGTEPEYHKYTLSIKSETKELLMESYICDISIPFEDITNVSYTFIRLRAKKSKKSSNLKLKVTFNFINHEDFNQKTLTTIIEKNQMNQWEHFIKKIPSHIETKIIGQRI